VKEARTVCSTASLHYGLFVMVKKNGSGQMSSLLAEQRRGWRLMIFCARATRGRGLPSLDARSGRSIRPHP